jgi:hypothetical protein
VKQRIALVEFSIFDQYPLVSGYLHSYANQDLAVSTAFNFIYYQREVERVSYTEALSDILGLNASIVCFSSYVWNMRLIKRLVEDLQSHREIQHIILGGHQVSHHIRQYVDPSDQKTIVINGQGEIPFRAVLQHLAGGMKLEGLKGISFYNDGELYNGGEADRLIVLDEIPSPFLEGAFDAMRYPITTFETNRGCPYKCTFCTWGGDTVKVSKFSIERLYEELLWIAKHAVLFIFIADANWGMLPRDIEISEYIGKLKKDFGSPWMVFYAAAKNKPKGSIACIEKFHEANVISSQALGIQSMNPETLALIQRKNIKNNDFFEVFAYLNKRKIDSYCELIWPLPGETLESLKEGFDKLIDLGAHTTIMYPAILINNAQLTEQAGEFGMETIECGDWRSELKLVKATKFANRAAVSAGFWHYYAFFLLSNFDLNKGLLRNLRAITGKRYAQVISEFADYLRDHSDSSAYAQLVTGIFRDETHGSVLTIGKIAAHLTYEQRAAAIADVIDFVLTRQMPEDQARGVIVVGLWAFLLPRLFAGKPGSPYEIVAQLDASVSSDTNFAAVASVRNIGRALALDISPGTSHLWSEILSYFCESAPYADIETIEIAQPEPLLMIYNTRDLNRNYVYAHGMINRLWYITPRLSVRGIETEAREIA